MDNEKIEYLKMIQEIIARMSTISSVVKGFSMTAAVAITAIMGCDFVEKWMLWIFLIPLLALIFLDSQKLKQRFFEYLRMFVLQVKPPQNWLETIYCRLFQRNSLTILADGNYYQQSKLVCADYIILTTLFDF